MLAGCPCARWLRRGKKTAGFELAIEFRWRAELGGGAAVTGSAKCAGLPRCAPAALRACCLAAPRLPAPSTHPGSSAAAGGAFARFNARPWPADLPPALRPHSHTLPLHRRVPHAAADELDELALEVMPDSAAAAATAAGGEGGAGAAAAPSDAQRQQAKAAVSGLLPLLEVALGQLLQRCTDK